MDTEEMTIYLTDEKIDKFLGWFVKHIGFVEAVLFGGHSEDAWVIGKAVGRLGVGLQWEAGPGLVKSMSFTLSPDGDPGKLAFAEAAIVRAPHLPNWEFHSTKPPKQWNYTIMIPEKGEMVTNDFSNFQYHLVAYQNRKFFDVIMYPDIV